MNKVVRVITALKGGIPDMVPFMFNTVMVNVQEGIVGHEIHEPTYNGINSTGWLGSPEERPEVVPALTCIPKVAEKLSMDAIQIQVLPPLFVNWIVKDGDACIIGGLIDGEEAFKKAAAVMPDPDDNKLLRSIEQMIERYKGDFAMGVRIRLGASPAILSMGMTNLSYFIADEDETLLNTIKMYTDWSAKLNKNLNEMDFDFFWTFDDIAFTENLMFSPAVFRTYFKENMKHAASPITKPLIFHSDGNYQSVLDDIIDIGADAIHPIEKKSMDDKWLKETYGKKLAMVGNVDIDYVLSSASFEEVDAEVKSRIDLFGPGGGYIICDSNSIPKGCKPENIIAMSKAVQEYRHIY
jgi:uroporphyrinogen decarboxylase